MNIPEPRLDPPEPKPAATCRYCGETIYEGEDIVRFDDEDYHLDCFQDKAAAILIERYGAVIGVA